MKLNKIKIYGKLRKDLGCSYFEAAVKSPQEAFRFLKANFPDLEKYMSHQYYRVKMNGNNLSENELDLQSDGVIQIIPIATGSAPAVGLLFTGFAAEVGTFIAANTFIGAAAASAVMTGIGATLIIGGVTQMLAPTEQVTYPTSDSNIKDSNYSFNGIANISRAGVTLPVVYGEIFVGSVLVSNGVDTAQSTNYVNTN